METKTRTITKAVMWQIMGLISMSTIAYIFTGSIGQGGTIALAGAAFSFFMYVIYERAWGRIGWGFADDHRENTRARTDMELHQARSLAVSGISPI